MIIDQEFLESAGAQTRYYDCGDLVFEEGNVPQYFYQIIEGKIKLNNYDEKGKEFIHQILEKGQSLGESFLFNSNRYPFNAMALDSVKLLRLSKECFLALLDKNKYENLCNFLSSKLYYSYLMRANNAEACPMKRLKGIMDYLKSFQKNASPFSFEIPLTRQQLASLTGLCVETAIRAIKKMEKNNELKIINRKILY